MKSDAGGTPTPPRHLSAVPVQREHAAPGGASSSSGSGSASSSGGKRPPFKRRTRYTARAAVLSMVFCALVLALAYPLQQYVSQSSQLDRIQQQNRDQAKLVGQLKQELRDWQDPAYVRIQARQKLHFVMPGETGLTLLGGQGATDGVNGPLGATPSGTVWYGQLWNSVTSAADPGATTGKTP